MTREITDPTGTGSTANEEERHTGHGPQPHPSIGIVIATRNRAEPLRACLWSIDKQTVLPDQTIIVDSSAGCETQELVGLLKGDLRYRCEYRRSAIASAAQQRNLGAEAADSDLVLFLDDDVVLEPEFVSEILAVFQSETDDRLAGVSGTISNSVYSDPKGLNRFLLGLCVGRFKGSYAGKVLGPAVNFLPLDGPEAIQWVEWMPSGCSAYRRDLFLAFRFESTFQGYSFAEDLHLSTRIARSYRLANTTRARLFHADLGRDTHRDWVALGESQVTNRHLIMTEVLGRNRVLDHVRLFGFEVIYTSLTLILSDAGPQGRSRLVQLLRGKLRAFLKVWSAGKRRT